MTKEERETIRLQFERWVRDHPAERQTVRLGDNGCWPGQYEDYVVQTAWEAVMHITGGDDEHQNR